MKLRRFFSGLFACEECGFQHRRGFFCRARLDMHGFPKAAHSIVVLFLPNVLEVWFCLKFFDPPKQMLEIADMVPDL